MCNMETMHSLRDWVEVGVLWRESGWTARLINEQIYGAGIFVEM